MRTIDIPTSTKTEIKDITSRVRAVITESGVREGICYVFVPHTTAAVTINENADPDVKSDILMALDHTVPQELPYSHAEGNSPAHLKASMMGNSSVVIVKNGEPVLGTWQGVYFCEFDGPRTRRVLVKVMEG
ncbi:MAG: YjbQ family protein [Candidatus Omnitrophica bacterium]|nr:YjbQ family protein [Candidatus Omnitrophota bacterium]